MAGPGFETKPLDSRVDMSLSHTKNGTFGSTEKNLEGSGCGCLGRGVNEELTFSPARKGWVPVLDKHIRWLLLMTVEEEYKRGPLVHI